MDYINGTLSTPPEYPAAAERSYGRALATLKSLNISLNVIAVSSFMNVSQWVHLFHALLDSDKSVESEIMGLRMGNVEAWVTDLPELELGSWNGRWQWVKVASVSREADGGCGGVLLALSCLPAARVLARARQRTADAATLTTKPTE